MIKTSLYSAARLSQHMLKGTGHAMKAVGLKGPVESFQRTAESLPGSDEIKRLGRILRDELFGEELPLYKEEAGPYEVETHKETFVDKSRDREIPTTVYYPDSPKEDSPVVVFSHGLGGNAATYRYFGRHLASHGYTVIQPTHVGSNTSAFVKKTPILAFTQEELVQRKSDVSHVLDLVQDGGLPKKITENADMTRVALAGHSFGALTAQAMAGVDTRTPDGELLDLEDDRIDAFVAMSPFGDTAPTHILGMDTGTYGDIDQPILYLSGDKDRVFTFGKGAKSHLMPYQETGTNDKAHVVVGDANHLDFAQVFGIVDPSVADITKSTSLAFLDAHLLGDAEAEQYLADDLAAVARSRGSLAHTG